MPSRLLSPDGDRVCIACYDKLHRKGNKMSEIRDEVKWFSVRMEQKLKANDDKGGWDNCSKDDLLDSMKDELGEMIDAASRIGYSCFCGHSISDKEVQKLINECADIANFAMMIADNARKAGGK